MPELTQTRQKATKSTFRSRDGNAVAYASEIAVSPDDPTDLKTHVEAETGQTPGGSTVRDATSTQKGVVEYANQSEIDSESNAGSSNTDRRVLDVPGVFRAIGRKVKNASTTAFGLVKFARNEDVADSETDLTRALQVSTGISLIRRLIGENVRSIPEAEESHVGRPLVAFRSRSPWGAWQQLGTDGYADDSITEAKLDSAARAKLNATGTGTGTGEVADNSLLPIKARAGTPVEQKDWRERLNSSHIGLISRALPAVDNHNTGDLVIIARGGATTVPFREIDDPTTDLLENVAGDVIMLLAAGWTRIGNLFSGGIAAAAAQALANANAAALARIAPFAHIQISPHGIRDHVSFPESFKLTFAEPQHNKTVQSVVVDFNGNTAQLSAVTPVSNINTGVGGVLWYALDQAARDNLATNTGATDEQVPVGVRINFDDGTFYWFNLPFRVNDQDVINDAVVTSIANQRAAGTVGPNQVISTITQFDATNNLFKDAGGNTITVPNGAIVILPQAVYDAAVADAQFVPNGQALFLTR